MVKKDTAQNTTAGGIKASLMAKEAFDALKRTDIFNASTMRYGQKDPVPKEFISINSQIPGLDEVLGGGIPLGKIGELYGLEGSGKSSLAYNIAVAFQKAGGFVVSLDTENSWDSDRFESVGGDISGLIETKPDTTEEVFAIMKSIISKIYSQPDAPPSIFLLDTLTGSSLAKERALLLSGKELPNTLGMEKAKIFGLYTKEIKSLIQNTRCAVLIINQLRVKMGTMPFQDPYQSTGGMAIKYFASYRIRTSAIGKLKDGEDIVGQQVQIKTDKCKTASPYKKIVVNLDYSTGKFDVIAGMIEEMKRLKWYKKTKSGIKIYNQFLLTIFKENYETEEEFKSEVVKNIEIIKPNLLSSDDNAGEIESDGATTEQTEQ